MQIWDAGTADNSHVEKTEMDEMHGLTAWDSDHMEYDMDYEMNNSDFY
jgi:hypothetical protein